MYPHERSLVKKLQSKPFALLGINTDISRRRARKVVADQHLTWPSWFDGTTLGPIDTLYNTDHWPTIYVLDAKGVIRFIDPPDVERAIDSLLKEIEHE